MLEDLFSFMFFWISLIILSVIELLLLQLYKKTAAYVSIHVILYALIARYCWNLLEIPDQTGIVGIKILFYLSLFVCFFTGAILLYYCNGFLFFSRLKGCLKGHLNACKNQKLPYQILYKDGTISDILSHKSKEGILWIYDDKKYLVSLCDRKISVHKAPIQKEKLLLAAAQDEQLQACLSAAGGRRIGNGVYFCIGTPSIAEDATCAVRLGRKGKMLFAFLYEEEVPRGFTRKITLFA